MLRGMGCALRRRARAIVDDLAIVNESSVTKPHPGSHLPTCSVSQLRYVTPCTQIVERRSRRGMQRCMLHRNLPFLLNALLREARSLKFAEQEPRRGTRRR